MYNYTVVAYPQVKKQPQVIKDLSVKLKLLKKHISRRLNDICLGMNVLNKKPFSLELRSAIYKWNLIKLK